MPVLISLVLVGVQWCHSCTGSPSPISDFTSNSATLSFPAGSGPLTSQSFSVQVVNDVLVESMEAIPLQASVVGGVAVGTFTAGRDTADIEIIDDDGKDTLPNKKLHSSQF